MSDISFETFALWFWQTNCKPRGITKHGRNPMSLVSWVQTAGGWIRKDRDHPKHSDYLPCSLCDKPVWLESSNADELGNAVHEECYVLKITNPTERFFAPLIAQPQEMLDYPPYEGTCPP
jgi:hypothetical protein